MSDFVNFDDLDFCDEDDLEEDCEMNLGQLLGDYERGYTKQRRTETPNMKAIKEYDIRGKNADQVFKDLISRDHELQLQINFLMNENKLLKDRMLIFYKMLKKFGISTELFD